MECEDACIPTPSTATNATYDEDTVNAIKAKRLSYSATAAEDTGAQVLRPSSRSRSLE